MAATDVDVPLAQVAQEPFAVSLDALGSRLLVRRVPGDRLRVKLPHDSVIFSAGEVAEVELQPHLLGSAAGGKVLLVAQLFAVRTTRDPLWSFDRELTLAPDGSAAEAAILPVKLPEAEGIYDLRIVIHRRALQNRLGWKQTVDERKLQFVVLAKTRPGRPMPRRCRRSPKRCSKSIRRVPPGGSAGRTFPSPVCAAAHSAMATRPPGSMRSARSFSLARAAREPNVSWEAYPLPIARPGQPHFVEVEYPADLRRPWASASSNRTPPGT